MTSIKVIGDFSRAWGPGRDDNTYGTLNISFIPGPPLSLTKDIIIQQLEKSPRAAPRGSGTTRDDLIHQSLRSQHPLAVGAQEGRTQGITGMQLSLVKQLVRREGGQQSTEGLGAVTASAKSKSKSLKVAKETQDSKTSDLEDPGLSASARQHFCYVLTKPSGGARGVGSGRTTYVGYTVDPERRLRQHNGQISGGARGTRGGRGSWSFLFVITALPTSPAATMANTSVASTSPSEASFGAHEGLSLEWHLKRRQRAHGKRPRRSGKSRGTQAVSEPGTAAVDGTPEALLLSSLPKPISYRLGVLKEALQHPKFSAFISRFIVYVSSEHMDTVTTLLSGLPCSVRPITELFPASP